MSIQKIYQDEAKDFQHLIQQSLSDSSIVPNVLQAEEKYEKHLKESEPILSNVLTPFAAFQEGFERAIASFIKLGQEDRVKKKIVSEATPKSEETELVEKLIKIMVKDFDAVKFIKKGDKYLALAHGKIYQFSTLIKHVNFNQIQLTDKELKDYHQLIDSGRLFQTPYLNGKRPTEKEFEKLDTDQTCRALTFAEKEAINIYTGSFYSAMNHLMRGEIKEAIQVQSIPDILTQKGKINHGIKETLLHIAVAVSGLNKLPDYQPPLGSDGQPQKYLYRAENHLPKKLLNQRKWAVLNGGEITTEMGFISTAFSKPAEGFFNEFSQVGLMIKNIKGKKITALSQFGNAEREILLPPTQMQWLYHKDILTDTYNNPMSLFIAKPVTVSPELAIDYVPNSSKKWIVKKFNPKHNPFSEIDTTIV